MSNSVYYRVVQPLPLFNLRIFSSFSPTPTKSISDVSLLLPSTDPGNHSSPFCPYGFAFSRSHVNRIISFFWLTYFTEHSFQVHPGCCVYQYFSPFYDWIIIVLCRVYHILKNGSILYLQCCASFKCTAQWSVCQIAFPYRGHYKILSIVPCAVLQVFVGYLIFCLSVHTLMDIWVVSTFRLLWIVILWMVL